MDLLAVSAPVPENPIKIEKHSRPAVVYWPRRRRQAKRLDAYVGERRTHYCSKSQ
jgi:hypothetical protein